MTTLLLLAAAAMGADAYNDVFQQADDLYAAGQYLEAAHRYEQLVAEDVVNPAVFFNLGNAYYRAGLPGLAITNYERALRLNPLLENARLNLAQAVSQTEHRLRRPAPPAWERTLLFWHFELPKGVSMIAAVVGWALCWILLALRLWRPLPYLRLGAAVCLLIAALFGMSAWAKAHPPELAVAIQEVVPVRYGTGESEATRFELFEGDRVLIDRRKGDWVRVVVADGDRGWARAEGVLPVGPPYERPSDDLVWRRPQQSAAVSE